MFRSKNSTRAGKRSFAALKEVWMGEPFPEAVKSGAELWEREYQDTVKKCGSGDPIDVLNHAIDITMHLVVILGQEKAHATVKKLSLPEAKAYQFSGTLATLGSLSHVVFAYAPAVATVLRVDPDRVCFDTVESIRKSVENRSAEMHPSYADGAGLVLSAYLASLFGERS